MIYLFFLFIICIYLLAVENIKTTSFAKQFIIWFPAYIFFIILPSFQNGVGTDYEVYRSYYYNNGHFLHAEKGEYLYYYLVEFTNSLGDPQFQFIIVSLIQGFLFFHLLFLLKKKGYKSYLIFFLYFTCTGIFHNQMNGLRQFICVYLILINSIIIYDGKINKFFVNSILAFFIHLSSVFSNLLLLLFNVKKQYNKKIIFSFFVISLFIYLPNYKYFIFNMMDYFGLRYLSYIDSEFSEAQNLISILTKLYYLPVIGLFWVFYLQDKVVRPFFDYMILIFSCTFFMFLQAIDFVLIARVWQYFNFFLIFPLYYVFKHSNRVINFFIFLYIIMFYMAKVVFFPSGEYEYFFYYSWL